MSATAPADSPPGSPLSEHGSDEFEDDVKLEGRRVVDDLDEDEEDVEDLPSMRPAKRAKTGAGTYIRVTPPPNELLADGDISSDTEGEAPSSPGGPGAIPTDDEFEQQVTTCRWRGCQAGDLPNMDELVKHIHEVHIGARQKKYACEWEGCSRIDATHASGYALRAHMRSHTREKPFYCSLPECDKAFTRSDALAKHMRTVHETEALRPSDPVPRYHSSISKPQKLKLVFKGKTADGLAGADSQLPPDEQALQFVMNNPGYPASCEFSQEEMDMAPDKLYQKMQLFLKLAEEEGDKLKAQCDQLEQQRLEEWKKKQLVLLNVIEGTLAVEVKNEGEPSKAISNPQALRIIHQMLPDDPLPMSKENQVFWRAYEEASIASTDGGAPGSTNGIKSEMDVDRDPRAS